LSRREAWASPPRIAHSYGDLDPVRMAREAPTGLAHAERFLAEHAGVLGD